jgi:SAM-dependent methyltransferase
MEDITVEEPSLDLGCGDGITSFVREGGNFGLGFDIFQGVADLEGFFEDEDIYDSAPDRYDPTIESRPDRMYTVGLDHKEALLKKAETLDFYRELVQHDNNEPLPFDDDRFQTIFSNAVYWVEEVDVHLSEIARVLKKGGKAILVLRTPHVHMFLNYLYSRTDELGQQCVEMLDRGRSEHYPSLYTESEWEEKLSDAGLRVKEARPAISTLHAGMWDIGLRPVSPVTIKMANLLTAEQRKKVKEEWIDILEPLLDPVCEPMFQLEQNNPPAEVIFVVESAE